MEGKKSTTATIGNDENKNNSNNNELHENVFTNKSRNIHFDFSCPNHLVTAAVSYSFTAVHPGPARINAKRTWKKMSSYEFCVRCDFFSLPSTLHTRTAHTHKDVPTKRVRVSANGKHAQTRHTHTK